MATSYTSNKKIGALDSASTPLAATNEIVINQNGDILKTPLSAVEAKVFDAKTAITSPSGTEVVVVRQTDNTLRQVALSDIVPALNITNAKVSASAAIEDSKLATINTAGKVTNNAVQATSANTADRIVARDGSGNFAAGTITATLSGNASTSTTATALATGRTISLTGDVTGTTGSFDGSGNVSAATTIANNSVSTLKLQNDSVTSDKLQDDPSTDANRAVTTNHLRDLSVTTGKIADLAVNNSKIANTTIELGKLVSAVQEALVPAGAVQAFAMNSNPSGWLIANGDPVSRSQYAALFAALVTNAGFSSQTFAVTIASPAVFTKASHGFSGGERLRLSTTGALPTGLNTLSDYFVEVINTNTFYLSTTSGGTRINTSGTQSGTHSYIQSLYGLGNGSTTFNLPDLRGYFVRGANTNGDGIAAGAFGAKQAAAMLNHTHTGTTGNESTTHTHTHTQIGYVGSYFSYASGAGASGVGTPIEGPVTIGSSGQSTNHTHTVTTGNPSVGGGTETRPANIALLYCIKF